MHKPSNLRDYFIACFIALILFVILGSYLYVRRGYLFDAPVTADPLYVPNKIIASVGMAMLALAFLIGPLTRYFDRLDHWLNYRKEIGIIGGFLALAHGVISYYFSPKKFPSPDYFLKSDHFDTFLAGFLGALLLTGLIVISLKILIEKIGGSRWWFLQRWGLRLVIFFSLYHVIVMKWSGWKRWFFQGVPQTAELANPWMTPASILVTLFVVWVVIVRLYESFFLFRDFGFKTKEISMDPVLKQRGRRFFLATFWLLVMLYVGVLTRWMDMV